MCFENSLKTSKSKTLYSDHLKCYIWVILGISDHITLGFPHCKHKKGKYYVINFIPAIAINL